MVTIEYIDGSSPPNRHSVSLAYGESIQIGRLPFCDLFVPDPSISGKHFSIRAEPNHVKLTDLGSRNGTRINGQKITAAEIGHGEEIIVGQTRFRIQIANEMRSDLSNIANGTPSRSSVNGSSPINSLLPVESNTFAMPLSVCLQFNPGTDEADEIRIRAGQTVVIGGFLATASAEVACRIFGPIDSFFFLDPEGELFHIKLSEASKNVTDGSRRRPTKGCKKNNFRN